MALESGNALAKSPDDAETTDRTLLHLLDRYQVAIIQSESKNKSIEGELHKVRKSVAEKEKSEKEARSQFDAMKRDSETRGRDMADLAKVLDQVRSENDTLRQDLDNRRRRISELEGKIRYLRGKLAAADEMISVTQAKCEEMEHALSNQTSINSNDLKSTVTQESGK